VSSEHFSFSTRVPICLSDTDLLCYLHLSRKMNVVDFDHAMSFPDELVLVYRNLSKAIVTLPSALGILRVPRLAVRGRIP